MLLIVFDHIGIRQPFCYCDVTRISGYFLDFRDFLISGTFRLLESLWVKMSII